MPRFTFTRTAAGRWQVTRVQALPTWIEYSLQARIVDLTAVLSTSDLDAARRQTYRRAYDRIVKWITSRGARPEVLAAAGR